MKTILALGFVSITAYAEETFKRTGNIIDVSCFAVSMSQGFARKAAINDCKKSAAAILDTTIKVNSKLWTTTKDVYMHTETDSLSTYEGLQCQPYDEVVQNLGKQVKVALNCKFDISTAKALEHQPIKTGTTLDITKTAVQIETESQTITLATFPTCDKISVVGGDEILCTKSMTFDVRKDLNELIIEKAGFIPYRVQLSGERKTLMIVFERL
jgi:hypothetical protein